MHIIGLYVWQLSKADLIVLNCIKVNLLWISSVIQWKVASKNMTK